MTRRKIVPVLALTAATLVVLFFCSNIDTRDTWRRIPQQVGLGDHVGNNAKIPSTGSGGASTAMAKDPDYANWNPRPVYQKGSSMVPGHNYTSTLVIAKTKDENVDWIKEKMPTQDIAVYVADDPTAPLHPPKNKGHEVMIYLSWVIDNYDNLPDVAIFMHAHQLTWHNDDLLGNDAHLLVTRLSRQRVWREGFVNMRCSWHPGCPDWMHPGETEQNDFKQEEVLLAKSWSELFPLDEVPSVLAQPCCAQFALSSERIRAKPYAQYVWYRDWLFSTRLPDHLSGRIWEYVWQFVFTGENVYCPSESICFCDQFGTCFGGEEAYADFIVLKNELGDRERDLREWEERKKAIEEAEEAGDSAKLEELEKPEDGKDEEFREEIDRLRPMVDGLKHDAEIRGQDPKNRALEAGREWHEGDDF